MIRSTSLLHYFGNPRTQSYGYVKYRISNPSRKRRETDTQFKVSKQNSILDLIDTYRILWKAVFDESRMYGLEGDLSYLSRSTRVKKPKEILLALIKRKRILEPFHAHVTSRYCRRKNCKIRSNLS